MLNPCVAPNAFPAFKMRRNALGINARLNLIRQRDDNQISRLHRILDADGIKPLLNRQLAVRAILAVGDDDLDPAVAQVQPMGMPLRSKAKNGHRLPLQGVQRGIFFINHFERLWH